MPCRGIAPFAWIVILAIGAVIVANWHTFLVCLIIAGILLLAGIVVVLLIHNHGSGYDEALERQAELEHRQRIAVATQRQQQPQQVAAPAIHVHVHGAVQQQPGRTAIHNHNLHLHGITAADMAAALGQGRQSPAAPALDQRRPDAVADWWQPDQSARRAVTAHPEGIQ